MDSKKIVDAEKEFFDEAWLSFVPYEVKEVPLMGRAKGLIEIPGIKNLNDKKILICSCGSGVEATLAAKQGGKAFAFDISKIACINSNKMAIYNGVAIFTSVADFNRLPYRDGVFDVIYGCSILHHIDCAKVGKELKRVLKIGGRAFFRENSDRNPVLRFFRKLFFGKPGGYQKSKFWIFKRFGTSHEYPLTESEVDILAEYFDGNIKRSNEYFIFFQLLDYLVFRNDRMGRLLWWIDQVIGRVLPFFKKYSFSQEILLDFCSEKRPYKVISRQKPGRKSVRKRVV